MARFALAFLISAAMFFARTGTTSAAEAGQRVTVDLTSCDSMPVSGPSVEVERPEEMAAVSAPTSFSVERRRTILNLVLQPGYYEAVIKTSSCSGSMRFGIIGGHDRTLSLHLRGKTTVTLWDSTVGVAGLIPKNVRSAVLYSASRGFGLTHLVNIEHGAYYVDHLFPDHYIMVADLRDGRRSQVAVEVPDRWYEEVRRDVSDGEISSAIGVLGSPYTHPEKIVAGGDGNMWFLDPLGNSVGCVHVNGDVTITRLPDFASAPADIAAGPDSVWVTESANDALVRIGYDGKITEYRLPELPGRIGPGRGLGSIVLGSDQRLWFIERSQPYIGAIDTLGRVSEYPLSHEDAWCIIRGPDGRMWFCGDEGVGAMDTAGTVATILPSPGGVFDLAPGADGVWADNGSIVHIALDGSVVTYPEPLGGSSSLAMAEGASRVLWFVDHRGETLGEVDSHGAVTQSYLDDDWQSAVSAGAKAIAVDRLGGLWVAEPGFHSIFSSDGDTHHIYHAPRGSDPTFVAEGRPNEVWFTAPNADEVGVVRYGIVTCFSLSLTSPASGCGRVKVQVVGSTPLPN